MKTCCVFGCQSKGETGFFKFPRKDCNKEDSLEQRVIAEQEHQWLVAIKGKHYIKCNSKEINLLKTKDICSKHFTHGHPAKSLDVMNIDWVPNQLMGRLPSVNIDKEVAATKERLMVQLNKAKSTVTTRRSKLLSLTIVPSSALALNKLDETKVQERLSRRRKKSPTPDSECEESPKVLSNIDYFSDDSTNIEPAAEEEPFKVVQETVFLPANPIFPEVTTEQPPKKETLETITAPANVFKCGMPQCLRTFPSFEQGKEHLLSFHAKSSGNISVQRTSKYHRCGVCSADFATSSAVLQHMQLQHKTKTPDAAKKANNKQRIEHLMEKLENFDWCQCRLCFVYYRLFLNHVGTAHKNGELGQLLFAKGKSKPPLSMLVPMSKKDNLFIQESAVKIEKELQLLDEGWMNETVDGDGEDVKPSKDEIIIDSSVSKTEIVVEEQKLDEPAAETMELDNDENFEDTDRYDEYFENDGINLAPVTDHQINISRETSPVPVKKQPPPPKPKKTVANTANKVYFQIKKVGDKKLYVCTACPTDNEFTDYSDVMDHFKVHAAKGQTYGVKIGSAIKSGAAIGQLSVKSVMLGSVGGANGDSIKALDITEFQCGVCEGISNHKDGALQCLSNHRMNGWIKNDRTSQIGATANVIQSHDLETAGEVEITDDHQEPEDDDFPPNLEALNFRCEKCNQRLFTHQEACEHMQKVHGPNFQLVDAEDVSIQHYIRCTICTLDFEVGQLQDCIEHRRKHHSYTVDYKHTEVTRYLISADGSECQVLDDLVYYKKESMTDYYECICDLGYVTKNAAECCFGRHIGVKPFKCKGANCGHSFYTELDLNDHTERIHVNKVTLPTKSICEVCGVKITKGSLKTHMQMHLGAEARDGKKKEVECKTCKKKYANLNSLQKHIQLVHKRERKYQCKVCFKRYLYENNAETCEIQHSGIKNFSCDLCEEKFYTRSQRRCHMKFHMNSGVYSCTMCDHNASSYATLQKHKLECHDAIM